MVFLLVVWLGSSAAVILQALPVAIKKVAAYARITSSGSGFDMAR
jgi:hypothetical protein